MTSDDQKKADDERRARETTALQQREKIEQVAEAVSEGKLPTTEQITTAIEEVQKSEIIHDAARGMTPAGKKVLADTEKLLATTKEILAEKNPNDELQHAVHHGMQALKQAEGQVDSTKLVSQSQEEAGAAKPLLEEGVSKIGDLTKLLASSSEFRKLLIELGQIAQDTIRSTIVPKSDKGDSKEKATGDEDAGKEKATTGEDTGEDAGEDAGKEKEAAGEDASREKATAAGDAGKEKAAASEDTGKSPPEESAAQGTPESTRDVAESAAQDTAKVARDVAESAAKSAISAVTPPLTQFAEGKISLTDAARASARAVASSVDVAAAYLLSDEDRARLLERFKALVMNVQKTEQYQTAIHELLDIGSKLIQQAKSVEETIAGEGSAAIEAVSDDIALAERNAKQLMENFANHKSLDPIIQSLRAFAHKMQTDKQLAGFFQDLRQFVVASLRQPEFVQDCDFNAVGGSLIERGRSHLLGNYTDLMSSLSEQVNEFIDALRHDSATATLTKDVDTLMEDLFLDEHGRPTIKPELARDFTRVLHIIGQKLEYLPLPRIEGSSDEYDFIFDNIVLRCSKILPGHIRINTDTEVNLEKPQDPAIRNATTIDITHIMADARDIAFYYNRKKAIILQKDVGYLDFVIGGQQGLTIHLKVESGGETTDEASPTGQVFRVVEAKAHISDLKLKFHETKNDFLYTFLNPLIQARVKKQIEDVVGEQIRNLALRVDEQITTAMASFAELQKEEKPEQKAVGSEEWKSEAFNVSTSS